MFVRKKRFLELENKKSELEDKIAQLEYCLNQCKKLNRNLISINNAISNNTDPTIMKIDKVKISELINFIV